MNINQKMHDQVELLEEQFELISRLEEKLHLVLNNDMSEDSCKSDKNTASINSKLFDALALHNEKIYSNNAQIKSLLSRLDFAED